MTMDKFDRPMLRENNVLREGGSPSIRAIDFWYILCGVRIIIIIIIIIHDQRRPDELSYRVYKMDRWALLIAFKSQLWAGPVCPSRGLVPLL